MMVNNRRLEEGMLTVDSNTLIYAFHWINHIITQLQKGAKK